MSTNFVFDIETIGSILTVIVAALAAYRSLAIAKSLVTRVYRTRAYWLAVLMAILIVLNLPLPPSSIIASDLSFYGFFVFSFAILIFIDSNVSVAKEIDFFHNDVLHWRRVRIPMFAILTGYTLLAILLSSATSTAIDIGLVGYFIMLGAIFAYSGTAMFAIARRTYDQTMKRFIKMLGFAVLCYLLFVTIWLPLDIVVPNLGDIVSGFIIVIGVYFFYKAAMSLSFVGRIVKDVA